jgi:hypothetical protein
LGREAIEVRLQEQVVGAGAEFGFGQIGADLGGGQGFVKNTDVIDFAG